MADTTSLIVPIDLMALCVGAEDIVRGSAGPGRGLGPAADFSVLPPPRTQGPYVSANALASSEAFEGEAAFVPGVHLHWALPDGLTHGTQSSADMPVVFPEVPNRWLLTRIIVSEAGTQPMTRSWVIESDRLTTGSTAVPGLRQPTVPVGPTGGQNYRYIGQASDLATWQEAPDGGVERLAPFTAVGYGEPAFAAAYPNCSTVFGFLDTFADVPAGDWSTRTVSYHVAGWYSDVHSDPLSSGTLDPADNPFRWRFSGDQTPTRTLCSGALHGIRWDPKGSYLDDGTRPLQVAVADSTVEALSALLADDLDQYPNAEELLNALQLGLLSNAEQIDSLASFQEAIHDAGFASVRAGKLWSVTTVTTEQGQETGGEVTLPDAVAADLNQLNLLQQQLDDLTRESQARQYQLFVDWYKYLLVEYDPTHVPATLQPDAVAAYLRAEIAAIADIVQPDRQLDQLSQAVQTKADAIRAQLGKDLTLTDDTEAPRHYWPTDPVLVLSGADVTPVHRTGGDSDRAPSGYLSCRLDDQLVTELTLAAGLVPGSAQARLPADRLPALANQPAGAPTALLTMLLREAIVLSAALQPVVAQAVAALGGAQNPAGLDFAATVAALQAAAAAVLDGQAPSGVTYTGTAPDPLLIGAWGGTPWLPIMLQYQVAFRPLLYLRSPDGNAAYPADLIDRWFRLAEGEVDLAYTGRALQPTTQFYSGSAILTPNATVNLASQIQRYLDASGSQNPELTAILAKVRDLPLLSQGLTGLTEALRMRRLALQLPVADPLAALPARAFVSSVAAAVGHQNIAAPMPEASFNPIRAGGLEIQRLRLVDAFGRYKDYDPPDEVVVASALRPPEGAGLGPDRAFLPPRITQPARLLFRWRSASDDRAETNSHPASSPILGWVLPNNLDDSLAVLDSAGTALGTLAVSGDRGSVLWTPAPGGNFPPGTPTEQVFAGENPHLRDFAIGAWNGGDPSFLAPFLDAVREALAFTLPPRYREHAGTAVLLGQPLVLARASLGLDFAEPAASDESWASFAASVLDGAPPHDAGLPGVRFPVLLGGLSRLGDTLVGYWIDQEGGTDYANFYTDAVSSAQGGVRPQTQDTLPLPPMATSDDAVLVTLLLDPRGSVHATSGILPVKAIEIPPDQYGDAISRLSVAFAINPVLSGPQAGALALPQPKVAAGRWAWVQATGGTWGTMPLTDAGGDPGLRGAGGQRLHEGWLRLDQSQPDRLPPDRREEPP